MNDVRVITDPALAARFFHGMADPARVAILLLLRDGERAAGDVGLQTGLSPSTASRQLACLRDCGLVEARHEWRYIYYRLADGVADFLAASLDLIERVAERVAACDRPEMPERLG